MYKKKVKMKINQEIKDIQIGKIQGDAGIKKYNNNIVLTIEHSIKNMEYVHMLWENQKKEGQIKTRPQLYWRHDKRYDKYNYSQHFALNHIVLKQNPWIGEMLNDEGKKTQSKNMFELLTPKALAYWIMDDGQRPSERNGKVYQGVTICTDNFLKEEVEILKNVQETKYNLKVTLHKKGNNYRLYISKTSMIELVALVEIFMIPTMLYKIRV